MNRQGLELVVRMLDDPDAREVFEAYCAEQRQYHASHSLRFVTSVPPRIEPAIQSAAKAEEYEHFVSALDGWIRDSISRAEQ